MFRNRQLNLVTYVDDQRIKRFEVRIPLGCLPRRLMVDDSKRRATQLQLRSAFGGVGSEALVESWTGALTVQGRRP